MNLWDRCLDTPDGLGWCVTWFTGSDQVAIDVAPVRGGGWSASPADADRFGSLSVVGLDKEQVVNDLQKILRRVLDNMPS